MADGLNYVPFTPALGLVEHIALHVEHQIVAGVLRSGDRIQESRIVSQLDVSRGSVRESFRVLERRRLIDVIPRKGAIVTNLSPTRVRDLTSVLPPLLTQVVDDLIPNWSVQQSQFIERAMQISEGKFGCVNPVSVLAILCQLHSNRLYLELIDDLIPTFDRVFSKLVRSNLAGVELLDQLLKLRVIPALEAGERDQVIDHVTELCRMLERKYLETLERTR